MVQKQATTTTDSLEFKQVQLKKTSVYIPQKMYQEPVENITRAPSMSRAPPPKLCSTCQAVITSNFCTQCGTKVGAPDATPAASTFTTKQPTARSGTKTIIYKITEFR
jgi:hypothetical protein